MLVSRCRIRRIAIKFVELKSRGGDYLVVAANIAYLRADENGQTRVGLIGGDALLVVGTIGEVAEKVLADAREERAPAA